MVQSNDGFEAVAMLMMNDPWCCKSTRASPGWSGLLNFDASPLLVFLVVTSGYTKALDNVHSSFSAAEAFSTR